MHNSGRRIITRMYTSPLRDASGNQTGWMTSVTDITEPTMYRNELANAQERFTTVLQSLDTAVSVAVPGTKEIYCLLMILIRDGFLVPLLMDMHY